MDLVQGDAQHFSRQLQGQHLFAAVQFFQGPLKHLEEFFFLHRFHQIVEGGYFVAFCDIVRITRNKDDL